MFWRVVKAVAKSESFITSVRPNTAERLQSDQTFVKFHIWNFVPKCVEMSGFMFQSDKNIKMFLREAEETAVHRP